MEFPTWEKYAFDLSARATWKTATRQEWTVFVRNKLEHTITNHLPTRPTLSKEKKTRTNNPKPTPNNIGLCSWGHVGLTWFPCEHASTVTLTLTENRGGTVPEFTPIGSLAKV